jgi:hypothetical protein
MPYGEDALQIEHTIELDSSGVYHVFLRARRGSRASKNAHGRVRIFLDNRAPDNPQDQSSWSIPAAGRWSWLTALEKAGEQTQWPRFTVDAPGKHVVRLEVSPGGPDIDAIAFSRGERPPSGALDSVQPPLSAEQEGRLPNPPASKLILQPSWAAIPLAAFMGFNIAALFIWVFFRPRPGNQADTVADGDAREPRDQS